MRGLLLLFILTPCFLFAQLKCADIFSDNMVLQRDEPVSIWGNGLPGKVVEVKFSAAVKKTTVRPDSCWMVTFQSQSLNRSAQKIVITSNKERLVLKNILIGDLWVCLGQSNMEWPMKSEAHYEDEISKSNQPLLRFYNPSYAGKGIFGELFTDAVLQKLNTGKFYKGQWQVSDSLAFKEMSAIAYYFGKEIIQHTGVPIGLIHLAIGGAPIETFINRSILEKDAKFENKVKGNWLQNSALPVWVRERGAQNIPADLHGFTNENGPAHPFKPGYVFEKGIEPLLKLPVKGILWYQGESNAQERERVDEYAELMKLLVNDYRRQWKKPALPFYFVQLSSIDTTRYNGKLWPLFRDEQRKAMREIQHSGMAVSSDVGARHDVHPRNKKVPGRRLARWALKNEYRRAIIPGGPLPVNAVFNDDQVVIHFQYAGKSLQSSREQELKGFSLDGISESEAKVEKELVIIKTKRKPDSIYYGWKPFTDANLVNEEGVPASTFKIAVQQPPSLLPLPQQVRWTHAQFSLNTCKTIVARHPSLTAIALLLQKELRKKELILAVQNSIPRGQPYISLQLAKVETPLSKEQAYHLLVTQDSVVLAANTPQGIFYGLQTLLQLMPGLPSIPGCEITDWPAFAWRGYMIDVGRNFMSMEWLKQQVDVMTRYKFNIFHFHFTEDIAWRLESKRYPQLTDPPFMLRNKGSYYSEAEMHSLIKYCRERNITLVPEIDMPGHSAAFTRAMGFNMQSDSGMMVVKNIIEEFIQTYDLPYFHIGADEVKITNKKFVPEITALIERRGKKVIGWQPGGNFTEGTIRQLWMDDNAHLASGKNIQYIDSRHLYINHMDPLEAVVTIFNRKIADKDHGDQNALGATLCMWHDRIVAKETDILKMNPVYPSMLAFAERTWRGGGQTGWTATIGAPDSVKANEFAEFETRLLNHRNRYFSNHYFPYAKQSTRVWRLFGPYANKGWLSQTFPPESSGFDLEKASPALQVAGGTIVLRHWWYPLIEGAIKNPEDSSTWYATTSIWSDEPTVKNFWIGFNNLSRSPATDSPPPGEWDYKKSSVWVNGRLISPPDWKRAGQQGHAEIPLLDEGYEYRTPAKIQLKKGWNVVLIKAPVGSFKGKDWQNPVKWMFTFVEAPETMQ